MVIFYIDPINSVANFFFLQGHQRLDYTSVRKHLILQFCNLYMLCLYFICLCFILVNKYAEFILEFFKEVGDCMRKLSTKNKANNDLRV